MKEYYVEEFKKHENSEKISVKGVEEVDRRKEKGNSTNEERRKKKTIYKTNIKIGNREILGLIILTIFFFVHLAVKEVNAISKKVEDSSSTIKKSDVTIVEKFDIKDCTRRFVSHSEKQGIYPNRAELEMINERCED